MKQDYVPLPELQNAEIVHQLYGIAKLRASKARVRGIVLEFLGMAVLLGAVASHLELWACVIGAALSIWGFLENSRSDDYHETQRFARRVAVRAFAALRDLSAATRTDVELRLALNSNERTRVEQFKVEPPLEAYYEVVSTDPLRRLRECYSELAFFVWSLQLGWSGRLLRWAYLVIALSVLSFFVLAYPQAALVIELKSRFPGWAHTLLPGRSTALEVLFTAIIGFILPRLLGAAREAATRSATIEQLERRLGQANTLEEVSEIAFEYEQVRALGPDVSSSYYNKRKPELEVLWRVRRGDIT